MRITTSSAKPGRNKYHIGTSRRRVLGFNAAARVCLAGVRLAVHFCCGVLRWIAVVFAFLFRAGRNRLSAFSKVLRLSRFAGLLWVCTFLCGDSDGVRGTESAARQSTFLRNRIGFAMLSAGRTLGAARPQTCAKESLTLWTLFIGFAAEHLFAKHCNNCYL